MGGTATLAAAPEAAGVVVSAEAAEINVQAGFHRHMAWLQAFRVAAPLAFAAWRWLAVHRPLKFPYALGRVERWQSPVDCARLEIV